jgi:hypothetical protein
MAHEFGHALGLPDLYDKSFQDDPDQDPSEDSAGIGRWGLMGWGAHGWNGDDGPNPFCAWSRLQLGWIGLNNERLIEVKRDTIRLQIADLDQGGFIYMIPLLIAPERTSKFQDLSNIQSYLLLEQKVRKAHYYNRNLPAEGLLVWHMTLATNNKQEETKLLDLMCADGLYKDAGYGQGRVPDPHQGHDNLDFWAHHEGYTKDHKGNKGDATDVFDGVRYTRLDADTNPSNRLGGRLPAALTGPAISMQRQGDLMVVDIRQPRWAGTIHGEAHWSGDVIVDGDLTIAPEGQLFIYNETRVYVAGADQLRSGLDPARCELRIQGELNVQSGTSYQYNPKKREWDWLRPGPVLFEALVPGEKWYGVIAESQIDPERVILNDAAYGLHESALQPPVPQPDQLTSVLEAIATRTTAFQLLPNYPNPFNPETTIRYALPEASQVRVVVYNVLGQEVRALVDGSQEAGVHAVVWDGRDDGGQEVSSGVYLYRLTMEGKYAASRRMLLAR